MPGDLERWLTLSSGVTLDTMALLGTAKQSGLMSIEQVLREYKWPANDMVPIAEDGFGNFYALATKGEGRRPVVFIEGTDLQAPQYVVASSLDRFLEAFIDVMAGGRHEWPFVKDRELASDPELAQVTQYPLPWEAA